MEWLKIDWLMVGSHSLALLISYVLAIPIAWDREKRASAFGLRTFPLVAVASCGLVLTGRIVMPESDSAQASIIQGLMTGVGFIGGGAILKQGATVQGTATAASAWTTAVAGIAVGYHRLEIALVLSAFTFITLRLLTPLKPSRPDQE